MKYNIIYADPPWKYGSKTALNNTKGNKIEPLSKHYKTMPINEIKDLPIKNITDKDCACFLWCTDSHLKEGIEVLESWGFKYKTVAFNWIKKTNKGNTYYNVAPWTLKSSELCLLGTKGKMNKYKIKNNVKQLIEEERTKHSKKPLEAIRRIEEIFGNIPRIELFCRFPRKDWHVWGDEVESNSFLLNTF